MSKLGLASNLQDEIGNVTDHYQLFKNVIDLYTVVDSGSTDGTQDKLRELWGNKLNLIQSDAIKVNGYGFARTRLVELSEDMDYVLIIDGDERMFPSDILKLKGLVDMNPDYDLIRLPRCHYQDFEMTKVEYGSMDRIGSDWREAIRINPDFQPRLIRRTMINGKSKVQFYRRVHELVSGVDKEFRDINNPVIRHFGFLKPKERLQMVSQLCEQLWNMDKVNEPIKSYVVACKENNWKVVK